MTQGYVAFCTSTSGDYFEVVGDSYLDLVSDICDAGTEGDKISVYEAVKDCTDKLIVGDKVCEFKVSMKGTY